MRDGLRKIAVFFDGSDACEGDGADVVSRKSEIVI